MNQWHSKHLGERNAEVLCLGAHCDDIEIGCGGTLRELMHLYPTLGFRIVVLGATAERRQESENALGQLLKNAERVEQLYFEYPNSFFPDEFGKIKEEFESLKGDSNPALIFTHYRDDRHQDHRVISDLTWNTFRDHTILEYEIPKYDGDIGQPNTYVEVAADTVATKVDCLMAHFQSQHQRQWFTEETFRSLMRLRGIECNSASGYAEAFYGRKLRVIS